MDMKNLALCIKMEIAYRRWIASDRHAARCAAQDDGGLRRLLVMIAPHL